jgi:ribosomal protein S18 acetylase RimI-like enzyme
MVSNKTENIFISNTTKDDMDIVFWLFAQAMILQGKNDYKVWNEIDKMVLEKDIEEKRQFKIVKDREIICIFSIQLSDPFIWREKDMNNAIYLHRIVVNPKYKGQKQFQKVLIWAMQFAKQNNLKFIRMDTWAENNKIIEYYKSFGFKLIENYKTTNAIELPIPNRNLNVALLEIQVKNNFS